MMVQPCCFPFARPAQPSQGRRLGLPTQLGTHYNAGRECPVGRPGPWSPQDPAGTAWALSREDQIS